MIRLGRMTLHLVAELMSLLFQHPWRGRMLFALLASLVLSLSPVTLHAGKRTAVGIKAPRTMFYGAREPQAHEPRFKNFAQQVLLDDDEVIERRISFLWTAASGASMTELPLAVIDAGQGDVCEAVDGAEFGVELRPMADGFGHLARPALCLAVPAPGELGDGVFAGEVVIRRPRVARMEDRFSLWIPIQPLRFAAENVSFEVRRGLSAPVVVETDRMTVQFARKALPENRERQSFVLERVRPLPLGEGVLSLVDRVPALLIRPSVSWDELALEHRSWWAASARLEGAVIPLAARVLAQPNPAAAVREAISIALSEISLDDLQGAGGTWLLPARASRTAQLGSGTSASRAALLIALLRGADIRATPVLLSRSGKRMGPSAPLGFLNQVLVLIQGVDLGLGRSTLFVDPSRGPEWLGALDELLLGRDAFLLSGEGARWLRTPADPPRRHWTLNVRETTEGPFEVLVEALLEGAPAARVRSWQLAGARDEDMPYRDLAWLGGAFRGSLAVQVSELPGGRLELRASGLVARDRALPGGFLAAPLLPEAAPPGPFNAAWPYSRDAQVFDLAALESWTFASRRPGGAMPEGVRTTPYWEVDALGRWSGPLFKRRSRIRFTGRSLARDATIEVERFQEFVAAALGGVRAP